MNHPTFIINRLHTIKLSMYKNVIIITKYNVYTKNNINIYKNNIS